MSIDEEICCICGAHNELHSAETESIPIEFNNYVRDTGARNAAITECQDIASAALNPSEDEKVI